MRSIIKEIPLLRRAYYRYKFQRPRSQSDETIIIARLAAHAPKTFIEFGFHPVEFNCAALARLPDWRGLLIDGNEHQVDDARALLPANVEVIRRFLTLENIGFIKSHFQGLGVLSIDVDGNDYWFLQELITARPDVISVEYNSTLGLDPITVPYDPEFDRHAKHPRGWYHGASLSALAKLCARFDYGLAAVSDDGCNAFFTRDGKLDPQDAWKPNMFRQQFSGVPQPRQWKEVSDLPFVIV
jgi:hypothetical protein